MTKLGQVSEPIFAASNFMHRRQVDIIPFSMQVFIYKKIYMVTYVAKIQVEIKKSLTEIVV